METAIDPHTLDPDFPFYEGKCKVKSKWYDVVLFSMKAFLDQSDKVYYVWPEEGSFDKKGRWSFNEEHKDFEPLLVDSYSRSAVLVVFNAVNNENATKLAGMLSADRGKFGYWVDNCFQLITKKG